MKPTTALAMHRRAFGSMLFDSRPAFQSFAVQYPSVMGCWPEPQNARRLLSAFHVSFSFEATSSSASSHVASRRPSSVPFVELSSRMSGTVSRSSP